MAASGRCSSTGSRFVSFHDFALHQKQFKPDDGRDEVSVVIWICKMTTDCSSLIAKVASESGASASCHILLSQHNSCPNMYAVPDGEYLHDFRKLSPQTRCQLLKETFGYIIFLSWCNLSQRSLHNHQFTLR